MRTSILPAAWFAVSIIMSSPIGAAAAPVDDAVAVPPALPSRFDPRRDAEADYRNALRIAAATNRLVLMYIGGDWCESCNELDKFFDDNPDIVARRDAVFVLLKVNYSSANKNAALIGRFPFFFGYPHWFLIDGNGHVVHSSFAASTRREFDEFLTRWGTRRAAFDSSASRID